MKQMFDKASDGLNLMITNKIKSLDLIDNLMDFNIIIEEIEKLNNNERLEVKKIEEITRKVLGEFKTEKTVKIEKWSSNGN